MLFLLKDRFKKIIFGIEFAEDLFQSRDVKYSHGILFLFILIHR